MYTRDLELEAILYEVMDEHEDIEHLKELRIAALTSDSKKTRGEKHIVYADCTKVSTKMAPVCDADFVITFYLPNIANISSDALRILCWHELKHVGWKDGKKSIIPHDLEDFKDIIDEFGTDWINIGQIGK